MVFSANPMRILTTEFVNIPEIIEEFFYSFLKIDAVLTPFGEDNRFFIIFYPHDDIPDLFSSETRIEE